MNQQRKLGYLLFPPSPIHSTPRNEERGGVYVEKCWAAAPAWVRGGFDPVDSQPRGDMMGTHTSF